MWSCDSAEPPAGSLLAEGAAMLSALAADFGRIDGVHVFTQRDVRLAPLVPAVFDCRTVRNRDEEASAFRELASQCDFTLIVAPEFDDLLLRRCRLAESVGANLLSPNSDFVSLAADKSATAERLACADVPVPYGISLRREARILHDFPFPAVLKPRFGAGSRDIHFVNRYDDVNELTRCAGEWRLEQWRRGTPASVAVLCGRKGQTALPMCRQRLSDDGRFRYLGGALPVPENMERRGQALAIAAVRSLPMTIGYVGVDLVMGDDPDGSEDVVIEINPRITTSYVGLRRASRKNLAAAMIDGAMGNDFELLFDMEPVEFSADGTIGKLEPQHE